jgi:natural product biosynthesis luciferase-like monooxygenase protein
MQNQLALLGQGTLSQTPTQVATQQQPPPSQPAPAARARPANLAPAIPMWKVAESTAAPLTPQQRAHLDALIARYCARTAASKAYAQRHRAHLADNRVVAGFRALTKEMHYPLVSSAARGARMWDIDGNEYIDVTMGFGVNLFGHNPPFVSDAISARLARGIQLGPQADLAGEVAELICELTGNERAAFVNSGTEAVMIACRLARAATGRDTIVIFNGAYHGQHDSTIAVTDPDDPSFQAIPGVPGITRHAVADTVMLNYGDESALAYIAANADRLAGVLVEPVQSRKPELQPREFLHALRSLTESHGIALIFDEMLTGFRCHPGGAQALFDVRADLVTYGKIVGGGLPIGVVSGRRRFMDVVDGGDWRYGDESWPEVETTFVSGTHSKHPLTMAAAHAALKHLKHQGPRLQQRLDERTAAFAGELNRYFTDEGLPIRVLHFSSLFRIAFAGSANLMYYHLLEKGVFLWEGRVYALSTAHTDADLKQIVEAIKASVDELRDGGFLPAGKSSGTRPAKVEVRSAPAPAPRAVSAAVAEAIAPQAQGARTLCADFSLSFFGRYDREYTDDKYDLLFAGARFADEHGFTALWVPERHFHPFGGFSPNPSVTAAALARETKRIQLRAGSVVVPLHHPIRIAEEWALVDNLSQGRVGIAAASGWHPEDFVLAPDAYRDNREITFRHIDTIQQLWRGDAVESIGGTGKTFGARIFPLPKQASLPIWITVVKNPDTYVEAGRGGFGILTNMMGQTIAELTANIALYRQARAAAGFDPASGIVTVLVHTYVTDDADAAQAQAASPFRTYLSTMTGLLDSLAKNYGKEENFTSLRQEDRDYLLDATYRRYVQQTALIGSPESCAPIVEALIDAGIDEFACFVDFGLDASQVLASLPHLDRLRARFAKGTATSASKVVAPPAAIACAAVVEEDL